MKKILAIAAVTIASISASASLELKYRGDYLNTPEYDLRAGSGNKGTSRSEFIPNYFRTRAEGKVGDATVKLSLDFTGANDSATGNMSSDNFVDYVYMVKPLAEGLTLSFGKIETFAGGIEGGADALGNSYLNTLANGGNAGRFSFGGVTGSAGTAAVGTLTSTTNTPVANNRGVGLTYNYGVGEITIDVTNDSNNAPVATTNTGLTQKKHNLGIQWSGSFMDGSLKPVIGYLVGSQDVGTTNSVTTLIGSTDVNAGVQYKMNNWDFTLEYLQNTTKVDAAVAEQDQTTSTYLLASYKMDAWKPFAKYETSSFKDQTAAAVASDATSFDRTGMVIGTEWTPKADGLSYHIAYLSTSDKYKSSTATQKETVSWTQLIAGMSYSADFLK